MDRETRRLVEEFRRNEASPIENNLIDELVAGELDRQDFLRRAAVFGLGAGTVGLLFKYLGEPELGVRRPGRRPGKVGGTLRVGIGRLQLESRAVRIAGRQARSDSPGFRAST